MAVSRKQHGELHPCCSKGEASLKYLRQTTAVSFLFQCKGEEKMTSDLPFKPELFGVLASQNQYQKTLVM